MAIAKTTGAGTGIASGYDIPTLIGLRGSEDLGGGLKANFNLETNSVDAAGTVRGALWGRNAWVGLSGDFGALQFGRQSSVSTTGTVRFDLANLSAASAIVNAGLSPALWYGSTKRSAAIVYSTPTLNGLSAGVSYITPDDNENTVTVLNGGGPKSNGSRVAGRLNYSNGPLAIGFAAESAAASTNRTAYSVVGSYDFLVARLMAGWNRSENAKAGGLAPVAVPINNLIPVFGGQEAGQGYFGGVSLPVGGAANIGIQYANNTTVGIKAYELFAYYYLSKATYLYANAVKVTASVLPSNVNRYALGILHNF